jgi:type IX secretion system substrate protein/PKD domain-containing protein
MKRLFIVLLSTFIIAVLPAQQIDIVWQQCLGTDETDYPDCITKTQNGFMLSNMVMKEYPGISNYHGSADAWVVEIDTLGNILSERCFGGSDGESFSKIIELPNREYYLFGGTASDDGDIQTCNHSSYDLWVVKIDSSMNITWERCYGGFQFEGSHDAIAAPNGGLFILGSITSSGGDISTHYGRTDGWLCRIDSLGNILWEKTYGNHGTDELYKIVPTSYGTYMLVGHFYETGGMIDCDVDSTSTYKDVWIVEIDDQGEILRQFAYGGSYQESCMDLIEVDDGFVFCGTTNSSDIDVSGLHGETGDTYFDIWVVKIDSDGNIVWQDCFGGSKTEATRKIFKSKDAGYTVVGMSGSIDGDVVGNHDPTAMNFDIWLINLDVSGELQWQQCIGGGGREYLRFHSVVQVNDYNYAVISQMEAKHGDIECAIGTGYWSRDAWVINIKDCSQFQPATPQQPIGTDTLCVNTDSITTYSTTYANNAWYYQWKLQPEVAGTVTQDSITTKIHWNPTYEGKATLKVRSYNDCGESDWSDSLDIFTYICLGTDENDIGVSGFVVYPNPVHDLMNIKCSLKAGSKLGIAVYDIFGRLVYNSETTNTRNIISINTTNWQKGLYFVRVTGDGISLGVRKVLVE